MQYFEKCVNNKNLLYAWYMAMFTRFDLILWTENSDCDLKNVIRIIETEIEKVENIANRFDENTEISIVNNSAFENEVQVSKEFFQIINECIHLNKRTLGYFDISVNSVNCFKNGISNIILNEANQSITFLQKDIKLDLSGFVKGYVLRIVKKILETENIINALINAGNSSILAIGNHPVGEGWKISIPQIISDSDCVLINQCLTTSGNSEKTKWPIINPIDGLPIEPKQAVSVITHDPAEGEALSIAMYMANKDDKKLLLKEFGATLFI